MNLKPLKISDYCREMREKTGLSQNAFAKQNNISHTKVNKIENGDFDVNPSPVVLARIADIYGFDINDAFAYGIRVDEKYLAKLNSYRLNNHVGTPALTGNELLDTFIRTYIRKTHSSDSDWSILTEEIRDSKKLDDSHYCLKLIEDTYRFNGYVYCIKSVSTINSTKDTKIIDSLIGKIVLNSLTETNESKFDYKTILIVTGSEKIYKYILNKYKNKINNTKFIEYRLFYCSYGKYKNNIIDDYLNKNDFNEWLNTLAPLNK